MSKKFSGLHSNSCFQNSQCSSKSVAVICIYFTSMLVSNFQNHFPFNLFSDSCLSKICVNTWVEEPYIPDLHAIPIKFTNKFLLSHYQKIAIAKNNERETCLIQVSITSRLACKHAFCLSITEEITDSRNLFENFGLFFKKNSLKQSHKG